jgi:large subunit ribosomal protein L18
LNNISAQIISDEKSETILSFSNTSLKDVKGKNKNEISFLVGEELGKLCISKNINEIVFDRNGFLYHGRVKSLADGIRKAGVKF